MQVDGNAFRRRRFQAFLSLAERVGAKTVLDVGGTVAYWRALEPFWSGRFTRIVVTNLGAQEAIHGVIEVREGDATAMAQHADDSFDLVHSNSVIEHVGGWPAMRGMAAEIRRLAPAYYVQTPYFGFPIEPHYRAPAVHWLPPSLRARILTRYKLGFRGPFKSFDAAMADVESINLLSCSQMRALFPDAQLRHERVLGLTKSLIAIRDTRQAGGALARDEVRSQAA